MSRAAAIRARADTPNREGVIGVWMSNSEWRRLWDELEAAEAKLARVEAERDHWKDDAVFYAQQGQALHDQLVQAKSERDKLEKEAETLHVSATGFCRTAMELEAERDALLAQAQAAEGLREALRDQKTGDNCWCEPQDLEPGEAHTDYCDSAREALAAYDALKTKDP